VVGGGLVEVIPHLKGLGVKYCLRWGYGYVGRGRCPSLYLYRSGLQPSDVFVAAYLGFTPGCDESGRWPSFVALEIVMSRSFGELGDWWLFKL
jgi:hypothetical protein